MPLSTVNYSGELRTNALHLKSQNKIITDAPTDNHGKGEAFSPTDLVATALASCMLTIIGIRGNKHRIDIGNPRATVEKIMADNPRRIDKIKVDITFDRNFSGKEQKMIEEAALNCPVAKSIHPDIDQIVSFQYT